jgi:hypothetical protein
VCSRSRPGRAACALRAPGCTLDGDLRAENFGGGGGKETELQLPKATVFRHAPARPARIPASLLTVRDLLRDGRTIREKLPDGLRCSTETGNLVMECCMEFLRMVSDEVSPPFRSAASHLILFVLSRPSDPVLL